VFESFDSSRVTRPDYLKNIDIVGTNSGASDVSATTDGYKQLKEAIKRNGKEIWCTLCGQEWERISPTKESEDYLWAPEERRLRQTPLKSIREQTMSIYWRN